MKVALIVEWLDAWRGGAETSTLQFIHHLLDLGVELEVFTRSRIPSRPRMHVHTILASGPSRSFKTLTFCRKADEAVCQSECDLVHAIAPSLVADIYQPRGGTYAETMRRNVAVRQSRAARLAKRIVQQLNLKQRRLLQLERRMFAQADRPLVVAISDYVERQLREHYRMPTERIRKVYNGVDPDTADVNTRTHDRHEVRKLYGVADQDVVALCVAHNFKLKGVHSLIEAVALLQKQERLGRLKVLVAGKDKGVRWRQLVHRLGLDDCIQFVGATQRIQAFYHAADFLVHPTFYDPCSRVVLEALASGLPAITTRFDGASEMIEEGVGGCVLADPADGDTLAEAIRRLADAASQTTVPTPAVAERAESQMRRHAEEMVAIYRTFLEGKAAQ